MATRTLDETMDINEIMKVLPHRYPMLLVDRIVAVGEGTCRGIKNVTINEPFFQGHYPDRPIMPGVLIIEAMAQTGAVILLMDPKFKGMVPVIGAIDDVKFKRQVVPGDQLVTDVELVWMRQDVGRIRATATVEGDVAAQMEMTFKLIPGE
ncbi:MAG: 3-hydroxyacyl-ACP dehydratase FabZ [Fimbriimonadaceae bacterium]